MLLLFNTAVTHDYAKNVLNTLAFPNGFINQYEYERYNVSYIQEEAKNTAIGEKVAVFFVDRHEIDYRLNKYIPLRFGVLKGLDTSDPQKTIFHVELTSFISSNPDAEEKFRNTHKELLFRDENGEEKGSLAFILNEEEMSDFTVDSSPDAWRNTVARIEKTDKVRSSWFVFTKLSVFNSKDKEIQPTPDKTKTGSVFIIKSGETTKVRISYYHPNYKNDINNKNNLLHVESVLDPSSIENSLDKDLLGTRESTVTATIRPDKDRLGQFSYVLSPLFEDNTPTAKEPIPIYSDKKLSLRWKRNGWGWIPYVLFAIIMLGSSALSLVKDFFYGSTGQSVQGIVAAGKLFLSSPAGILLVFLSAAEALLLLWIKGK